jgi:hypothetical protein
VPLAEKSRTWFVDASVIQRLLFDESYETSVMPAPQMCVNEAEGRTSRRIFVQTPEVKSAKQRIAPSEAAQ